MFNVYDAIETYLLLQVSPRSQTPIRMRTKGPKTTGMVIVSEVVLPQPQ